MILTSFPQKKKSIFEFYSTRSEVNYEKIYNYLNTEHASDLEEEMRYFSLFQGRFISIGDFDKYNHKQLEKLQRAAVIPDYIDKITHEHYNNK